MWSPYGLKKLGIENALPFFTRGFLFDVQGLKGRILDIGEEIAARGPQGAVSSNPETGAVCPDWMVELKGFEALTSAEQGQRACDGAAASKG